KFDWEPIVVAPPWVPLEPEDPGLLDQVPQQAVVYPARFPWGRLARLVWRFTSKSIWLPSALLACTPAIREQRPDGLLTSGPPHSVHALGLFLKRSYGLPWLADFRDPWVGGGKSAKRLSSRRRWEAGWEKAVMRGADVIIANAPRACENLRDVFPRQGRKMLA